MKRQTTRPSYIPVILFFSLMVLCFTSAVLADQGQGDERESDFSFSSLIEPLGACALVSLLVTFGTGLFRRRLGRRFLTAHRTFAWLTIIFALCHGVLVSVLY
jgi:hypothetical protein